MPDYISCNCMLYHMLAAFWYWYFHLVTYSCWNSCAWCFCYMHSTYCNASFLGGGVCLLFTSPTYRTDICTINEQYIVPQMTWWLDMPRDCTLRYGHVVDVYSPAQIDTVHVLQSCLTNTLLFIHSETELVHIQIQFKSYDLQWDEDISKAHYMVLPMGRGIM